MIYNYTTGVMIWFLYHVHSKYTKDILKRPGKLTVDLKSIYEHFTAVILPLFLK